MDLSDTTVLDSPWLPLIAGSMITGFLLFLALLARLLRLAGRFRWRR